MKNIRRILILAVLALATIPATAFMRGEDTPRMKCLKKCQAELTTCLKDAGTDEAKKSKCNKALNDSLKLCPKN